ncbi:MAG: M23 family metallopeptidase [Bacteroidales bacterium]|nr:M23 family metallopeptidase [Bacteroidales bacterium]
MISKKKKYNFNPDTLSYVEVKHPAGKRILRSLLKFIYLNILAFLILIVLYSFVNSPEAVLQNLRITKFNTKYAILSFKVDSLSSVLQNKHFHDDNIYRGILELDSLPENIRIAGTGGHDPYAGHPESYPGKILTALAAKIENLQKQVSIQEESYDEILNAAIEKKDKLEHYPAITPVNCTKHIWISSYFGSRNDPFTFRLRTHTGIDFVGPKNTEVYSTATGNVTLVKQSRRGYGNEVVIDHGYGYNTRYAHLNKILVKEGQKVERGELIGLMGNTGRSTGTHLHYEVRVHNRPTNPIYFFAEDLSPEEFEELTNKSE